MSPSNVKSSRLKIFKMSLIYSGGWPALQMCNCFKEQGQPSRSSVELSTCTISARQDVLSLGNLSRQTDKFELKEIVCISF